MNQLLNYTTAVRCLRDLNRGGVDTILNEIAVTADDAVEIDGSAIPVSMLLAKNTCLRCRAGSYGCGPTSHAVSLRFRKQKSLGRSKEGSIKRNLRP